MRLKILREATRLVVLLAMSTGTLLPAQAATKTLMLYGDSLMAGLGLQESDAFAAQLRDGLKADGL